GEMAALDWTGLLLPKERGGVGQGMVELVLLCEELGRGPVASPLIVSTTLVALPLLWAGSRLQQERWLPGVASGEVIGTMAVLEPAMRNEWDTPGSADTKILVPWAADAGLFVVVTPDGLP